MTSLASAVVVTVTAIDADGRGFITAWPTGLEMPPTSTVNYAVGQTRANGAVLALGAAGALSLFVSESAHIVVDVSGEFVPADAASAGRYVPVTPARAFDTRDGGAAPLQAGGTAIVPRPVAVPSDASAVVVLLTATESRGPGFLTAYPSGHSRPLTSSLNVDAVGQTRTATQIVPITPAGLTVFSSTDAHVIVDVVGYFTGASAPVSASGLFIPASPVRILDTRLTGRVQAGGVVRAATAAALGMDAGVAAVNVTITEPGAPGYVTTWAAQTPQPATPAVSYEKRGDTVANLGIVSLSTTGIAVASTSGSHVVVDVTGWFTGSPLEATMQEPSNDAPQRPTPTGPIGCLQYVAAPSADGVYEARAGSYQLVVHIFTPGPNGPIVVVGDSLTALSANQTARALRARGWGPICVDGTMARTIEFGTSSIPDGLDAALRIRASDPIWDDDSITWVIALGTNDVGFSAGDETLSDQYIADQLAVIGPNPVSWLNVRTLRPAYQWKEASFNESIVASGVTVIDWYGASDGQGWTGPDQAHLTVDGYQARAEFLATSVRPW